MLSKKDMQEFLAKEEMKLAEDLDFVSNLKSAAREFNLKKIILIVVSILTLGLTTAYNVGSEYDREKARKYGEAQVLQEKQMYQDAIDVYDKLYGYKNSGSFIRDCEKLLSSHHSAVFFRCSANRCLHRALQAEYH